MNISPLKEWGLPLESFFLAAGPCSAESEEQVMATARELADSGLSFFRAGIWKPRTRPGSFEGVGQEGLKWLVRARKETGLRVGIEVAAPDHVVACLKHGIDVVWIGARTTTNPFAIQDLADALQDTDIPVFVKNPISPDLELWLGGIERLYNAGLRKIGVIHRGFSSSRRTEYRNAPNWKIPIELKRRFPKLPIICDPSHICGNRELLFSVAQEALDLLYDGLMMEVHINPAEAQSDANQQLTPESFKELKSRLKIKKETSDSVDFRTVLNRLRVDVDDLDEHLIELLARRMDIVREMGAIKQANDVSALQPQRWKEILESRIADGERHNLAGDFVFQVFQAIHEEAIRQQEEENPNLTSSPSKTQH